MAASRPPRNAGSPRSHGMPQTPSRAVLRAAADGRQIAEIERSDISRLKTLGYTPPERFTTLAADGKTTLYGTIFRPGNFDPAKRYPIIDSPYPGPAA